MPDMRSTPATTSFGGGDQADIKVFGPVTAKWGVHVGWGIDTHDWDCANSASPNKVRVVTHLKRFIPDGSAGVILMHAAARLSAEVLPDVVAALKAAGYSFVMAQDCIKAKCGASSFDLAAAATAAKFSNPDLIHAASKSSLNSEWVQGINPD